MNNFTRISLFLVISFFASFAYAEDAIGCKKSGGAVIPTWQTKYISSTLTTYISLSNVSNEEITVNVKLFDSNGNQYTEASESGTQFYPVLPNGAVGDPATETGLLLPAKTSLSYGVKSGSVQNLGFGTIEWHSENCLYNAMTGGILRKLPVGSMVAGSAMAINAGIPF